MVAGDGGWPILKSAPPSRLTKVAYSLGAVAAGVKSSAFDYFLLIFYSQVVGLDARLVGLAVVIALVFDAVSDPVVGYWSDNLRSPWGRRHPFMYGAALPVSLSFFLLFNPPMGAGEGLLFAYLVGCAIVIRTAITFFETPNSALVPDMTQDYDERTKLFSLRYFFGWTGGNIISLTMFVVLFPAFATEAIPDGRFNPEAYQVFGIIGSIAIFASVSISSLGTHSQIGRLRAPPPARKITLGRIFSEMFETLAERSFLSLFVASVFGAVASGLATGLSLYFFTFFWEFTDVQTGAIMFGIFIAAFIGFALAPIVTRTIGKKKGAMIVGAIAFLGAPTPILLRLIGILPENGTTFIFWFVVITNVIDVGLIICFQILFSSMVADLVEQSELRTGRRSEGVFTAAMTFVRKSVQGVGVMAASFVLVLANFPKGADPSEVPDEAIWRLGMLYVPTILTLWAIEVWVISTYRIDRNVHEQAVRKLQGEPQPGL